DPEERRNRQQQAAQKETTHAQGSGFNVELAFRPRRTISLVNPWRVTPSSCAARARCPPVRASAARMNCASNVFRAASRRDERSVSMSSKFGGSADGGTTPRRG